MDYMENAIKILRKGNKVLKIYYDDESGEDPRSWDNFCTLKISWDRYSLGDDPDISPGKWLDDTVSDEWANGNSEKILSSLKDSGLLVLAEYGGDVSEWRLAGERLCDENELMGYNWAYEISELLDCETKIGLLSELGWKFRMLSMYEHSGLALKQGVHKGWDAGVCGFCALPPNAAEKAGLAEGTDPDEWSELIMDSEIGTYASYIAGEVYGFRLFEIPDPDEYPDTLPDEDDMDEIDSCWGYIGDGTIEEIICECDMEDAEQVKG